MPVVAIANAKGGSGKTTAALLLATELARGAKVTPIDADPRRPLTAWAALPNKPANIHVVTSAGEKAILDEIEAAATVTPFVIIDLEGVASRMASFAMSQADLVIIPAQEQQQDVAAAIDVIAELHRDMRATSPRQLVSSTRFKKDLKSLKADHHTALTEVVGLLQQDIPLPDRCRPHSLVGI